VDLLKKMLAKNPKERISVKEALEHPWIVNPQPDVLQVSTLNTAQENMKKFQEE
jgi:serine/threonine protein kinase